MAVLDERTCRAGIQLRKMITASEMFLIKRFLNNFQVRTSNIKEPFVDRSSEYGDWTIWIPEGGTGGAGFPWSKLAFGYALTTIEGETEEDDDTPVVNINAGSVRMHGLRVYTYTPPEGGSELPLVGDECIVFIEIDRLSAGETITLSAQTVMTPTTATTLRIPLYTFIKTGEVYALHVIHNMGDINIDQPIR